MLKRAVISHQTPKEIVKEMDKFIIGQDEAKKAVAIAFVNRGRRMMITDEELRAEISPKNVLLSGPTGVGKTEIARRMADITDSPFLKVEMTKFTEVGYAGKDVESIIRDLVDLTIKREKDKMAKEQEVIAKKSAVKYVAKAIRDAQKMKKIDSGIAKELKGIDLHNESVEVEIEDGEAGFMSKKGSNKTPFAFPDENVDEDKLANGEYDNIDIVISIPRDISKKDSIGSLDDGLAGGIGGAMTMISIIPVFGVRGEREIDRVAKTMKVREALEIMADYYVNEFIDKHLIIADVLRKIEQKGVIFLDEIDKLISNKESQTRGEVSREGVQRDLLPIIEGTMVQTKYGSIRTDHILFIAAGAFHDNKISDLMPELQGRFPVSVELKSLTVKDFECILTDLKYNLPEQQQKLLKVDGIDVKFEKDGIKAIAEITQRMNSELENTGARRLFSVMEKVIEEVSFSGKSGTKLVINRKYVEDATKDGFDKKIDTRKYMI